MITELGKKSSVLSCSAGTAFRISFLLISLTAPGAASIPVASLSTFYSQFWLKLPVLFFAPLSETPSSLLFLQESRGPLIPQKTRWLFFRDIFRPIEFSGRSSFISAPLTPTFIPVLAEGALLPLHLCIITFLQLLHVFCSSKTSFKKKRF